MDHTAADLYDILLHILAFPGRTQTRKHSCNYSNKATANPVRHGSTKENQWSD